MTQPNLRRLLVLAHLYLAALVAPAFLLVGVTGGLYVAGVKGDVSSTPLSLSPSAALDLESPTLADDVRALLKAEGVDVDVDYVRTRGETAYTRPTSKPHVKFDVGEDGLSATLNKPDLAYAMMELHKGHGPVAFRTYQIAVGTALTFVVIGGIAVGFLAPAFRRQTIVASGVGLAAFALLAFIL
ncbi:MAG: hypothetical protein ACFB00_04670 [Parvularculaceae bacterium]